MAAIGAAKAGDTGAVVRPRPVRVAWSLVPAGARPVVALARGT